MAVAARKNIDQIWTLLEELKKEEKIELAVRLIDSLRRKKASEKGEAKEIAPEQKTLNSIAGSWSDFGMETEEITHLIRESRFTNRKIESFD